MRETTTSEERGMATKDRTGITKAIAHRGAAAKRAAFTIEETKALAEKFGIAHPVACDLAAIIDFVASPELPEPYKGMAVRVREALKRTEG